MRNKRAKNSQESIAEKIEQDVATSLLDIKTHRNAKGIKQYVTEPWVKKAIKKMRDCTYIYRGGPK